MADGKPPSLQLLGVSRSVHTKAADFSLENEHEFHKRSNEEILEDIANRRLPKTSRTIDSKRLRFPVENHWDVKYGANILRSMQRGHYGLLSRKEAYRTRRLYRRSLRRSIAKGEVKGGSLSAEKRERKAARKIKRQEAEAEYKRMAEEHTRMHHQVLRHTFFIKKACALCAKEPTSRLCRYCMNFEKDRSLSNSPSEKVSSSESSSESSSSSRSPTPLHRCELEKSRKCKGHWSKKCYCIKGPAPKKKATGLAGLSKKEIEHMERYKRDLQKDQNRLNAENGYRSDDLDEE